MPKGELDLSSRTAATKGGANGSVYVAGKAEESLLWQQIDSNAMPPKQPLTSAEKAIIKQWIDDGATWGSDTIDVFQYSSDTRAGRDWWSLQPIRAQDIATDQPGNELLRKATQEATGGVHPIDIFVQQARQARRLTASPRADKRTLIRRLTFDLLGLPPTPAEIERFLADESPHAYDALVDRLLDSPHYGERWARHWLDVVRFGESNGFEYDEPRDNFWHYRNWVIDAFNADMPTMSLSSSRSQATPGTPMMCGRPRLRVFWSRGHTTRRYPPTPKCVKPWPKTKWRTCWVVSDRPSSG